MASPLTGPPVPLRVLYCRRSCFCNLLPRGLLLGLNLPQPARLSSLAVGTLPIFFVPLFFLRITSLFWISVLSIAWAILPMMTVLATSKTFVVFRLQ